MPRHLFLLSIVSFWLIPPPVHAAIDRDELEQMLSDYERIPKKAELLHLGPGPDLEAMLRNIILHPSPRALARIRAISVLQYFPSAANAAVLRNVIQGYNRKALTGVALLELQNALPSYAVVAGPKSLDLIQPFLTHSNVDVRYSAANATALSRSPLTLNILMRRYKIESSPIVQRQLDKQIKMLRQLQQKQ